MRRDALERENHRRAAGVYRLTDAERTAVVHFGPTGAVPSDIPDHSVISLHRVLELSIHFELAPGLHPLVLNPLVIADRHTAGVGNDVRNQVDAALGEDLIPFGSGGPVGALGNELHL